MSEAHFLLSLHNILSVELHCPKAVTLAALRLSAVSWLSENVNESFEVIYLSESLSHNHDPVSFYFILIRFCSWYSPFSLSSSSTPLTTKHFGYRDCWIFHCSWGNGQFFHEPVPSVCGRESDQGQILCWFRKQEGSHLACSSKLIFKKKRLPPQTNFFLGGVKSHIHRFWLGRKVCKLS